MMKNKNKCNTTGKEKSDRQEKSLPDHDDSGKGMNDSGDHLKNFMERVHREFETGHVVSLFILFLLIQILMTAVPEKLYAKAVMSSDFQTIEPFEPERLKVTLSQFSINSYRAESQFRMDRELADGQGLITIEADDRNTGIITTQKISRWIEEGVLDVAGVGIDANRVFSGKNRNIHIIYEFDTKEIGGNDYYDTHITLRRTDVLEGLTTSVILFNRMNSVLRMEIITDDIRPFIEDRRIEKRHVAGKRIRSVSTVALPAVSPVFLQMVPESVDRTSTGAFIARNKYWLMGGVVLIGSGTVGLISAISDDSSVYLPVPPGRP